MYSLLDLPLELIALVASHLDRPSLKALRHTSHAGRQATTAELFRAVRLFPDDASCDRLESLLEDAQLSKLPQKIYIYTIEKLLYHEDALLPDIPAKWPKRWKKLFPRMNGFRNIQSVVLQFDQNYAAEAETWTASYLHDPPFRFRGMHAFFSMVTSLRLPVTELGIWNLQVDNPKNQKTLDMLADILPTLETLRLTVVSEYNEAAPEHDIELPEPHQFFQELPSTWLTPPSTHLRHLSLISATYFGFTPSLNLNKTHFPHLQSLSLGKYTISQDPQIAWIISHASTLQTLSLDDCCILYDVGIWRNNLPRCALTTDDMELRAHSTEYPDPLYYRSYSRRWHEVFRRFAAELPRLRRFVFGSSRLTGETPFEREDEIKVGLFINRYMPCYQRYAPSGYCREPPEEDEMEPPRCDEEDREALRALLGKLGQRVKETYSFERGGHEVRELIERDPWKYV